jgi:hypothetical protein
MRALVHAGDALLKIIIKASRWPNKQRRRGESSANVFEQHGITSAFALPAR